MSLVIHWKTQKLILLSKINLNYALFYVFKNYFHKNVFANVTYLFVQFITFTVKVSHNSRIFLLNFSSDMKGKVVEGRGGGSGNGRFTSLILWAGLPIFTYILTSRHNFANSLDNKNKRLRTLVVELSEYTHFFTKKNQHWLQTHVKTSRRPKPYTKLRAETFTKVWKYAWKKSSSTHWDRNV